MNKDLETLILAHFGASGIVHCEPIQMLWSGYGELIRLGLDGADVPSVIVKHIQFPQEYNHPRGWNNDISHQRKLKSYQVEVSWYQNYLNNCDSGFPIPKCYLVDQQSSGILLILEDLKTSGYPVIKTEVTREEFFACIRWLAHFHAANLQRASKGLWETGTYWHLETRPDELDALTDIPLKNAASAIDQILKACPIQTLVHGDAKLANFCFSDSDTKPVKVAAVDFQYVGQGCGMKDLAYFVGSCLNDSDCEKMEQDILNRYFAEMEKALKRYNQSVTLDELESVWRPLYAVAWADFHRFLKGWSPEHWKINSYSERLCTQVLSSLNVAVSDATK